MKKILSIWLLLLLCIAANAQSSRRLRVYQQGGSVDTLTMTNGSTIAHSRLDLNGQQHPDYVSLIVTTSNLQHQYLIANLDSLVLPNGHTVVFRGRTADLSLLQEGAGGRLGVPFHTSFSGTFPGGSGVTYYWTENDHIRLDVGYESRAKNLTNSNTQADFLFEDADLDADAYTVYYPDKQVTILSHQTQTGANNTEHVGPSGDCGVATATRDDTPPSGGDGGGSYSFSLQHKAAYLCFLPHIDHLPSAKVTRIELYCEQPIAGTYELSETGLYNVQSGSHTIALDLVPQQESDFFIGHDKMAEQDSVAAYMVIAPQSKSYSFTATYYVTDTLSRISKTYRQQLSFQPVANRVYPITFNISDADFHAIDLGLSCNWSNVNAGADDPSKSGPAYASDAEANAALLEQTVVTEWLMPDEDQREEILEKCTWTRGVFNGVSGYFVEGATVSKEYGQKLRIFIPCAEGRTKEQCLADNYRPVEALMIDLGLPSGTKWAARNLGANSPEGSGEYYAFGETSPKAVYDFSHYQCRTGDTYLNLGEDYNIAGTQNDAAAVIWGGIWTMPTKENFTELTNTSICSWSRTTLNGMTGYMVTGPNGNRIFLPEAGFMKGSTLTAKGVGASYQASNQSGDRSSYCWTLSWHRDYVSATRYLYNSNNYEPFSEHGAGTYRPYGRSIRPVASPNGMSDDGIVYNIRTDSTTWKLGDTKAALFGTLSSTKPIKGEVTVGFVVGDSVNIDKEHYRFLLSKTTALGGVFSDTLDVYDNIGYYYRAFVETADTVFYGKARHYGYEMVDLGLSVKWANMNIGADQPSDYGNYYAWGETEPKETYSKSTYLFNENQNLGEGMNIAGTNLDVAHVKMGNAWRMPNYTEMKELIDNCSWVRTSVDNVSGYRVTSKKEGYQDKSIFLPAAGIIVDATPVAQNLGASYWTSSQGGNNRVYAWTLSWHADYSSGKLYYNNSNNYEPFSEHGRGTYRPYGRTVRAIAVPNTPTADGLIVNIATDSVRWRLGDETAVLCGTLSSTTPLTRNLTVGFLVGDNDSIVRNAAGVRYDLPQTKDQAGAFSQSVAVHDNFGYYYRAYVDTGDTIFYGKVRHYGLEIVDLGLPSGTKWANMNVGASRPEEYGDYYAWGETETKESYTQENYLVKPNNLNVGDYRSIIGTSRDAAHVNMGNAWQMPSYNQFVELRDQCTWNWTSENNVSGFRVVGPNKKSIFLPCAGYMNGTDHWFPNEDPSESYHGGSYYCGSSPGDTTPYAWTLSWCSGYSNTARYLLNGYNYEPFWDHARGTVRYFGRSVRAVFAPNATTKDGMIMHVETDKADWLLDDTEATIHGRISSTTVFDEDGVNVGFIVGDSAKIVIGKDRAELRYTKHTTVNEAFQTTLTITGNMGYWYRAFVEYGDTVIYGQAQHVGWEMVDLGLPSGTKWANMNVGASRPEDYGNYYAWGETTVKDSYTSGNYSYLNQNIGSNIAGTNYDAAYVNMGNDWQMPSYDQLVELRDRCSWSYTTSKDVNGFVVTGPNGNSIFLPCAGYMDGTTICFPATDSSVSYHGGSYWCSQNNTGNLSYAWTLSWCSGYSNAARYLYNGYNYEPFWDYARGTVRWFGRSVRAVKVEH